jgi:hypothetical protein
MQNEAYTVFTETRLAELRSRKLFPSERSFMFDSAFDWAPIPVSQQVSPRQGTILGGGSGPKRLGNDWDGFGPFTPTTLQHEPDPQYLSANGGQSLPAIVRQDCIARLQVAPISDSEAECVGEGAQTSSRELRYHPNQSEHSFGNSSKDEEDSGDLCRRCAPSHQRTRYGLEACAASHVEYSCWSRRFAGS